MMEIHSRRISKGIQSNSTPHKNRRSNTRKGSPQLQNRNA